MAAIGRFSKGEEVFYAKVVDGELFRLHGDVFGAPSFDRNFNTSNRFKSRLMKTNIQSTTACEQTQNFDCLLTRHDERSVRRKFISVNPRSSPVKMSDRCLIWLF